MTDEEMTKEYVDKLYAEKVSKKDYDKDGRILYRSEDISDAFLAGLKAGRPKWHKVADGDLPNTEREVLVFMWGSYYLGYYKQYDGEDSSWHFTDFDEESEQIVAWCEIPQYTEE